MHHHHHHHRHHASSSSSSSSSSPCIIIIIIINADGQTAHGCCCCWWQKTSCGSLHFFPSWYVAAAAVLFRLQLAGTTLLAVKLSRLWSQLLLLKAVFTEEGSTYLRG
jgi:hypothetical protein